MPHEGRGSKQKVGNEGQLRNEEKPETKDGSETKKSRKRRTAGNEEKPETKEKSAADPVLRPKRKQRTGIPVRRFLCPLRQPDRSGSVCDLAL
ncbi:hypothetical protein B6K86_07240 [Lachnospiraceae bacterium]|nr:hypothetical protein B6K86_07240 [Lachnospiraceae bacterium]